MPRSTACARAAAVIDLADRAIDAGGHVLGRCAERRRGERPPPGRGAIELHVAAEKIVGIEIAEHEIRIGHRRLVAAAAVGGTAGHGLLRRAGRP